MGRVCGQQCCNNVATCFFGSCCNVARQCGSRCCPRGQTCIANDCCADSQVCGRACCPSGSSCVGGTCCPAAQVCGPSGSPVCCGGGTVCEPITGGCACVPYVFFTHAHKLDACSGVSHCAPDWHGGSPPSPHIRPRPVLSFGRHSAGRRLLRPAARLWSVLLPRQPAVCWRSVSGFFCCGPEPTCLGWLNQSLARGARLRIPAQLAQAQESCARPPYSPPSRPPTRHPPQLLLPHSTLRRRLLPSRPELPRRPLPGHGLHHLRQQHLRARRAVRQRPLVRGGGGLLWLCGRGWCI